MDEYAAVEEQKEQLKKINGFKSINKYPARYGGEEGLKNFIDNLENDIHKPDLRSRIILRTY